MPENIKDSWFPLLDSALIVESSFSSRREIIRDLYQAHFVRNIVEAKSLNDGLRSLKENPFDACFIGPSLNRDRAADFLEKARNLSKTKYCAFVAILPEGEPSISSTLLQRAGASEILSAPYQKENFTACVHRAVQHARARAEASTVPHFAAIQDSLINEASMAKALTTAALGLRTIVEDIDRGTLQLDPSGGPSKVTRDAITVAFEDCFFPDLDVRQPGKLPQIVVELLVDWISNRISLPEKQATESLRRKLVSAIPT